MIMGLSELNKALIAIETMESAMRKYLDRRGLEGVKGIGTLAETAMSLTTSESVIILTGFLILDCMTGETDGPIGAVSLANGLIKLGKKVTFVTDCYSEDMLASACRVLNLSVPIEVVQIDTPLGWYEALLKRISPTHIVAIERPGCALDGRCYTMAGEDLSAYIPNMDVIFELAAQRGILTIGIGDGGNEMGMGGIWPYIHSSVAHGEKICAKTPSDFLLVAGVSNWGGHALTGALSALMGRSLLHSESDEKRMLESIVAAGGVDGYLKQSQLTVDGLSLEENIAVFKAIRGAL